MRNKLTLLFLLFLAATAANAQYNKPNAVSYESKTKSYYVLNNGNGTITKLDSFFNTSQVITGLKDPQDLLFADLGTTKVLLVLDSQQIKVFDQASNSLLLSIPVPGSKKLRSGALDMINPSIFYLSDVEAGKIYKGSVGPAPFYQVTFTTLASGIDRPSGLLFDSKNRLLVVNDTFNSNILQVNTTTGIVDTLAATSLSFLHSIKEDAQGNYFITSHGDSYLYRFNNALTGFAKLTGYNKPSGMFINTSQDLMVLACTGCGKIYFNLLHLMATNPVNNLCPGDSFILSMNIAYNGIGTYGTNNVFYVEVSDSNGSFANPIVVHSHQDILVPFNFKCQLPNGKYGNNHQIRVRATNPKYVSSSASITPNTTPGAFAAATDVLSACPNQKIQLGSSHQNGINYQWSGPKLLNDTTISSPFFVSAQGGMYTYYLETRNGKGCIDRDTVIIDVADALKIQGVPDTIKLCIGDTVSIGQPNLNYVFDWSPRAVLNSSTISQVRAFPTSNVRVNVTFSDTAVGCSGSDSVELSVYTKPSVSEVNLADSVVGCDGKAIAITANSIAGMNYIWSNSQDLFLGNQAILNYTNSVSSEKVKLLVQNELFSLCQLKDSILVIIQSNPTKPTIVKIDNVLSSSETAIKYQWYLNGNKVANSDKKQLTISSADNGFYQVEVFTQHCSSISDSIATNVGVLNLNADNIKAYPMPFNNQLIIKANIDETIVSAELFTIDGNLLQFQIVNTNQVVLNTEMLSNGIYALKVVMDNGTIAYKKVIKAWK